LATIWEYKKTFLAKRIDFFSYLGPFCPICGDIDCYRQITPYFRYAIELFPCFRKERIPIARFLCRRGRRTFSLLPIQLIPYFHYTVAAVIGTIFIGFRCWQRGQKGFLGAVVAVDRVDPDSLLTPWLIFCWLKVVVQGFRRAHAVLGRFYDLSGVRTRKRVAAWEEVGGYFSAFAWKPDTAWEAQLCKLMRRYSQMTAQFLFGTTSQQRLPSHP
jgi:hypothetical protein